MAPVIIPLCTVPFDMRMEMTMILAQKNVRCAIVKHLYIYIYMYEMNTYILIVIADIGYFVYTFLTSWRYAVIFWSRWQTITPFHAIIYPCLFQCGRRWIRIEWPQAGHDCSPICCRQRKVYIWISGNLLPYKIEHTTDLYLIVLPFFSPLIMPILLSMDASCELFELHSLLDGGRPTLPRSATPSGSLKPSERRAPIDICCRPLKFSLNGPDPYLDNWPLCKLVDCCIRSLRKISSSESELVYPSYGRLRAAIIESSKLESLSNVALCLSRPLPSDCVQWTQATRSQWKLRMTEGEWMNIALKSHENYIQTILHKYLKGIEYSDRRLLIACVCAFETIVQNSQFSRCGGHGKVACAYTVHWLPNQILNNICLALRVRCKNVCRRWPNNIAIWGTENDTMNSVFCCCHRLSSHWCYDLTTVSQVHRKYGNWSWIYQWWSLILNKLTLVWLGSQKVAQGWLRKGVRDYRSWC